MTIEELLRFPINIKGDLKKYSLYEHDNERPVCTLEYNEYDGDCPEEWDINCKTCRACEHREIEPPYDRTLWEGENLDDIPIKYIKRRVECIDVDYECIDKRMKKIEAAVCVRLKKVRDG